MMNIAKFCSISGISGVNKESLLKKYNLTDKKEYSEWFSIVSVGYNIPNDMSDHFKPKETVEVVAKTKKFGK